MRMHAIGLTVFSLHRLACGYLVFGNNMALPMIDIPLPERSAMGPIVVKVHVDVTTNISGSHTAVWGRGVKVGSLTL